MAEEYMVNIIVDQDGNEVKKFLYNKSITELAVEKTSKLAIEDFNKRTKKYVADHTDELRFGEGFKLRHRLCTSKDYTKDAKSFTLMEPDNSVAPIVEMDPDLVHEKPKRKNATPTKSMSEAKQARIEARIQDRKLHANIWKTY